MAPRLVRGRQDDRVERDRNRTVVGLRRHIGADHGHSMLSGVAALDVFGIIGCVRVRSVWVRHCLVPVGGGAVMMVGVIVVDVCVDVLERRRPRGRQHGHGDDGCDDPEHRYESMGKGGIRQNNLG